jgi:hypothetical protein
MVCCNELRTGSNITPSKGRRLYIVLPFLFGMPVKSLTVLLALLGTGLASRPIGYTLSENIVGHDFLEAFNFQAITDPTHGRVYVPIYSWTASSL